MLRFFGNLARCTSGNALIETIIILPLAISLMIGLVDFGWALSMQATANKSVRGAARYLGTLPPGTACTNWAVANARNLAIYGNLAGTGTKLIPGWEPDQTSNNVTVDCSTPDVIIVSATVPVNSLMLATFVPILASLRIYAEHEQRPTGA
jgi:Flp pilus assembly protein TadG